jgi:hypothetical protein
MRISVRNTPSRPATRLGIIGLPPPPPPHAGRKTFPVFPRLSPAAFAVLLSLSMIFTACETPNSSSPVPTVTGVSISPQSVSVSKGDSQQFTAAVAGENS